MYGIRLGLTRACHGSELLAADGVKASLRPHELLNRFKRGLNWYAILYDTRSQDQIAAKVTEDEMMSCLGGTAQLL